MSKSKYIICSHLLNDYSGSPFVLSRVISALLVSNYKIKLYLGSKKSVGFLSNLPIEYNSSNYVFHQNKIIRLIALIRAQLSIFFKILIFERKENCSLIYANTLYSFGAALAGKLKGIRIIYHIHETYISPYPLKWFVQKVVSLTANEIVFVSAYHQKTGQIKKIPSRIIYNCINDDLHRFAVNYEYKCLHNGSFNVLMICSLKEFKGIKEFIAVAKLLIHEVHINFTLILNANEAIVAEYLKVNIIPENVRVYGSQKDLIPIYSKSSLVLNLTRIDEVVETFGLTILEAITFGIPVIAPPVGGPTELVDDGANGYLISCYEIEKIANKIVELSKDRELCQRLSKNAKLKAAEFSPAKFESQLLEIINA